MLEREVEDYFKVQVEHHGGCTYKLKFLGIRGAPDRIVFLPWGRIYVVELKRPVGGKLSGLQGWLHRKLAAIGCQPALLSSKWEIDRWFVHVLSSGSTNPEQ